MNVKINTKEKFHAITLLDTHLTATMSDELESWLVPFLQKEVKNVVIILKDIQNIDIAAAQKIIHIQQKYYDNNASFVICELQDNVQSILSSYGLLEIMNTTPTESEAGDIIQMEEIERELMNDED
jgi:anti-anti-sigma factor